MLDIFYSRAYIVAVAAIPVAVTVVVVAEI